MPCLYAFVELTKDKSQWEVQQCPFCQAKHLHGAGEKDDDPLSYLGNRAAHCAGSYAEYRQYCLTTDKDKHGKEHEHNYEKSTAPK